MNTIHIDSSKINLTATANINNSQLVNKQHSLETNDMLASTNFDTFTMTGNSEDTTGIYSPKTISMNNGNAEIASVASNDEIYATENYYSTSIPLTQMACNIANIGHTSSGQPIINSATDSAAYSAALNKLNAFTPIHVYNQYSDSEIGKGSYEDTIFTYDHQYFLYALTENYEKKSAYAAQGYEIDAYLLMGIAFGESNATVNHSDNPFGASEALGSDSVTKATERAVQALQDCGLAANASEAATLMASDSFYQKAAEVLSYMDNGYEYNTPLHVNYESLNYAMDDIERWREAVESGSTDESDYAYRYY